MADVQIQQTPSSDSGGASWLWAIIVLVLLGVIAWFVFGGGLHKTTTTNVKIETPGAAAPAPSGGTKTPKVPRWPAGRLALSQLPAGAAGCAQMCFIFHAPRRNTIQAETA
jgi:hypothetical protein